MPENCRVQPDLPFTWYDDERAGLWADLLQAYERQVDAWLREVRDPDVAAAAWRDRWQPALLLDDPHPLTVERTVVRRFDKPVVGATGSVIGRYTLPPDGDLELGL